MKRKILLLILLSFASRLMAQHIEILQEGQHTSIRGLSVVDDKTAWISGSKGTIATTTDGGKTWNWQQVKGFEKADFRDIEAFSDKDAVIMSSGTPALILKTTDGGANWKVTYNNADTAYFLDAMDFADKQHGYVLGDPINGKFVLLETKDGGKTWRSFKNPPIALPGEAAFAASGTCLRFDKDELAIVTGGKHNRYLIRYDLDDTNKIWIQQNLKFPKIKPSQGAFSFAQNQDTTIFVGGDYANDKRADSVAEYQYFDEIQATNSLILSRTQPSGFQSCVEYITNNTFLSTGTPGSNITVDGGKTWAKIDDTSYNVCRKAKNGNLVLLAGNGGKIGIFKP